MRRSILALLLMPLLLASCTLAKISGRAPIPLMLNNPTSDVEVIQRFEESKMTKFDYTGAFDVSEVLGDYLSSSGADAVTNLTIEVKSSVGSFFLNMITLGLANARVFSVEGELVRMGEDPTALEGFEVVASGPTLESLFSAGSGSYSSDGLLLRKTPEGYELLRQK